MKNKKISIKEIDDFKVVMRPLIGTRINCLKLPLEALKTIEPSQIGTVVGALMDAMIPYLDIPGIGIQKHEGILGDREGYPDYKHQSGKRLELKLLFVDNPDIKTKKPLTPREPSARITQKVTVKNVDPAHDVMLLIAYRLEVNDELESHLATVSPTIIDFDIFSMIELVEERDKRLIANGGRWFGDFETPTILSNLGKVKKSRGEQLDESSYGRKESEEKDYNEDTNFGKLKRIPHPLLQAFLLKHRYR